MHEGSPTPTSRILVARFGALGDIVLLTVLLRALRTRFPTHAIDVVTKAAYKPLLDTHPAVTEVIGLNRHHAVRDLAREINTRSYEIFVDAHGSLRTRVLRSLAPAKWHTIAKPRWKRFLNVWTPHPVSVPHLVEQYIAAVASLGVHSDHAPPDLHPREEDFIRAAEVMTGEYVVLATGAAHHTKRWPAESWRSLSSQLASRGTRVVGVGVADEARSLDGTSATNGYDLPLRVAVALIAGAKAVVAHDSAMTHVATAMGVPVVVIYGPTHPRLGYAALGPSVRAVGRSLACRPCSVFGGPSCPAGHHRCMLEVSPDDVMASLAGFL